MEHYNWTRVALRGIEIGFNKDQQVDSNKTPAQLEQARSLLRESIELRPDKAWPYIKLADLVDDINEKIKIYEESLKAESTDYAKARLYELTYISKKNITKKVKKSNTSAKNKNSKKGL